MSDVEETAESPMEKRLYTFREEEEEELEEEEEGNFWKGAAEEDDYVPKYRDDDDDEEETDYKVITKKEETVEETEEVHMDTTEAPAENGVEETEKTEKKKKKKRSEDGDKKSKKKKKKKKGESEKENKGATSSTSPSETGSEEEEDLCPTPPLYNGHAITNGVDSSATDVPIEEEIASTEDSHSDHDIHGREGFRSLLEVYNREGTPKKEFRAQTPLSDEEDLAGVNVRKLRFSYLSAAQEKINKEENLKSDLNTGVNITDLVGAYSSPVPRAATPSSRPDDLTPVSLRSLKSAYEATATGNSSAGSRHGSSSCSSPVGGSPAPKEELNISLHQLREEYCRSVLEGDSRSNTPTKAPPETGISIKQLQVSQMPSECKQCGKQVFQMERIVAEKAAWHKNCFRCKECNIILTLETYQSHEGILYCKPHFRDLFRPKAVIEDPVEARKDRSGDKPDYGLEELSSANVRQKFAMFEQASLADEDRPDGIGVRRSSSLMNRAGRYMFDDDDDYGVENSELGDYEEDEEDEEEEEEGEGEEGEGEGGEEGEAKPKKKKKITRPISFAGLEDLKKQKNRREEMRKRRNQELSQFRQMLCAGKNISTREMFESGNLENQRDKPKRPEPISIDGRPATRNLRERFEKGEMGGSFDDQKEIDDVFRNAETASKARNLFKQLESGEGQEDEKQLGKPKENRLAKEGCDDEEVADYYGRDPNLIKCTDNLEEAVDCRKTKSVLAMFRKMEMQGDDDTRGPRPLKRFTPPPEGEYEDSDDDEYSDEEYSDEEEEDEDEESDEEESDEEEGRRKPKYKDEILEMTKSSQSARKAASLRAKFERWETEVEQNNEYNRHGKDDEDEECMPSIDTARNLRAMFENKAQEASRPVVSSQPKLKVNRFVGGGGDKCLSCDRTVYAMERLEVAGRVLHKNCFKCCKCSTKLSMNSFSIGGEDIYCMTHYKQAFTEKGTYDVFTPNKGKWTKKIEATSTELAKSQE